VIYTCQMYPEVQQDYPGDCPKCGTVFKTMTWSSEKSGDPR